MSKVRINKTWDQGLLTERSKIIMPVQERILVLSREDTGVYGEQTLSTDGISECHCVSTGKVENGMLKVIGEVMPISVELKGQIGVTQGPTILHYTCNKLFGLWQGISASHITLLDWSKYKEKLKLRATRVHWLATNHCKDSSNVYFGMFFADGDHAYADTLYELKGNIYPATGAVRPIYHVPIYNPKIKIEVPEEGGELRLILP